MPKFKKAKLVTFILIFAGIGHSFGQMTSDNIKDIVLKKAIKDSLFVVDTSQSGNHDETQLRYLGILKSTDGRIFKIMSYCWIWGISQRATNRILIYNKANQYLGNYKLDTKDELPTKIEGNKLIFSIKENERVGLLQIHISFEKGLPKHIFIKNGNLYVFDGQ